MTRPAEAKPVGARMCRCVATHNPTLLENEAEGHHVWPKGMGGPDIAENMRWLCPTTHTKVHNLWREWVRLGAEPPWSIMRRYSGYVRGIVADGWAQVESAGRVHDVRAMMHAREIDPDWEPQMYLKAIIQLVAAILAAILPGIVEGPMGFPEWVNVGMLAAGAVLVYNSANIPGYRWAKLVASAVVAVGVILVSALSDGVLSYSEIIQIVISILGSGGVAFARNKGTHDGVFIDGPHRITTAT